MLMSLSAKQHSDIRAGKIRFQFPQKSLWYKSGIIIGEILKKQTRTGSREKCGHTNNCSEYKLLSTTVVIKSTAPVMTSYEKTDLRKAKIDLRFAQTNLKF